MITAKRAPQGAAAAQRDAEVARRNLNSARANLRSAEAELGVAGVEGAAGEDVGQPGELQRRVALLQVGLGLWTSEQVAALLAARDRALAPPPAPACGLCLIRVDYELQRLTIDHRR